MNPENKSCSGVEQPTENNVSILLDMLINQNQMKMTVMTGFYIMATLAFNGLMKGSTSFKNFENPALY